MVWLLAMAPKNDCGTSKEATGDRVTSPSAPQKADVATAKIAADVTVRQFAEDYAANEIAADAKYRDKVIRVTGIVAGVERDDLERPFVGLIAPGKKLIKAVIADESAAGALKKGVTVALRCRGQNYGRPELAECLVESTAD